MAPDGSYHSSLQPDGSYHTSHRHSLALTALSSAALMPRHRSPVALASCPQLHRYCLLLWHGGEKQAGFWEVSSVDGLGIDEFAAQRAIYHVTDRPSLIGISPGEVRHFWLRAGLPVADLLKALLLSIPSNPS